MRYFLFTYMTSTTNGYDYGEIIFTCKSFPSKLQIAIDIGVRVTDCVITNCYEFKNEQDYKDFRGEE